MNQKGKFMVHLDQHAKDSVAITESLKVFELTNDKQTFKKNTSLNRVVVSQSWGGGKCGDIDQRVQTFSYKRNKF